MAVPSSGQLRLRGDIALEVYGNATGTNISLGTMSDVAGFASPDAMTDFYGWTNAVAPSVTTNNISNVLETSVTTNGNVTSDGGGVITERGFYVGTNGASPTNNTKYTVSGTTGYYSRSITGINNNTTYYCWAFATNVAGTTYGSRVQATTVQTFTPVYFPHNYTEWYSRVSNYFAAGTSTFSATITHTKSYINPYTGSLVTFYTNSGSYSVPGQGNGALSTVINSGNGSWCNNAVNDMRASCTTNTNYLGETNTLYSDRATGTGAPTFTNITVTGNQVTNSTGLFTLNASNNLGGSYSGWNIFIRFNY